MTGVRLGVSLCTQPHMIVRLRPYVTLPKETSFSRHMARKRHICMDGGELHEHHRVGRDGNSLFDDPDPLRIASLPVASIVATIVDGGAVTSC